MGVAPWAQGAPWTGDEIVIQDASWGVRANQDSDGATWVAPYEARVEGLASERDAGQQTPSGVIPADFLPWWDLPVRSRSAADGDAIGLGVDVLVHNALQHSPHIQSIATEPLIRSTALLEENAAFDWRAFLESNFVDTNDPIGNTLTTGNNDERFRDQNWSGQGGVRQRNRSGGEFEIAQRLGRQANNSRFLLPNPQGTTRLELSYTQPLLSGNGRAYNESRVVLAAIDADVAKDEVVDKLQIHLLKVTEAYWDLYRSRAEWTQRKRVLQEAERVLASIESREGIDTVERQTLRARAAVASRRSEIARAEGAIRNAESQLRLLVNDPILRNAAGAEFVPSDSPMLRYIPITMRDGLGTALRNRPDISQAIRDLSSASVRTGVAKNELLPQLDLVLSTYVAGLEGDTRIAQAFGNQFAEGRPGFTIGLQYEVPLGNQAARARHERRRLEFARAAADFRATVEQALTETEIAIREVDVAYAELCGRYEAMLAADRETAYLSDRWSVLPGIDDSVTLLLEDLLDSQVRRADEESAFVRAEVSYVLALVRMRQATGTLLRMAPRESTFPSHDSGELGLQSETP